MKMQFNLFNSTTYKYFACILILCLLSSIATNAQLLSASQIDTLIEEINKSVDEHYVIREKVTLIKDSILAQHYYSYAVPDTLVKKINEDVERIVHDKHLFLQYKPDVAYNLIHHINIYSTQNKREKKLHYGFTKCSTISKNIAYFKFDFFADTRNANKIILSMFRKYKSSGAIIIDMRNNLGGSGTMIQLLCGIFLQGSKHEILQISYKDGRKITLKSDEIPSGYQLTEQPLYLLCSKETYSAAEAFAFILKNRNRAIVIGETTAGGGNVAGPHALSNGFVLTIPAGTIVDPVTNTGWEHSGVTPNIVIVPEHALEKAIELIRQNQQAQ